MACKQFDIRRRDYLRSVFQSMPDERGNREAGMLEHWCAQNEVSAPQVRKFRDGTDGALSKSLQAAFSKLMGSPSEMGGFGGEELNPLILVAGHDRDETLQRCHLIDRTRTEAHSALDAWADLGVTGAVSDPDGINTGLEPEVRRGSQAVKRFMRETANHLNTHIFPNKVKLAVFRGMAKYGDQYGEIGVGEIEGGGQGIVRLAARHVRTMRVNLDEQGEHDAGSDAAYSQVEPNSPLLSAKAKADFPYWKIARFSNLVEWGSVYGESIFEPCMRSWIQVEAMEAAMIIRRLTRAPQRYNHTLDVGHLATEEERRKARDWYATRNKKARTVDAVGNMRQQKISLPTEEDLITLKAGKDSQAGVEVLAGDGDINKIEDFLHFFNKWLAGLGPPKAHLGYEGETMRSVITDLHIVFARKVRRMQMKFLEGLNHLYWVSLLLRGVDPRSIDYVIYPPSMGTRDELIRAQVMLAYATTIRYLASAFGASGKQPSPAWFLKYVLKMDEEAIEALEFEEVLQRSDASPKNDPASSNKPAESRAAAEMADLALGDDRVALETGRAMRLTELRAMDKRLITPGDLNPFGSRFDEVVRAMGVKELHRVG